MFIETDSIEDLATRVEEQVREALKKKNISRITIEIDPNGHPRFAIMG